MFDKILIANRGEIACRVIATARRMGISTVAVYSDADADAQHVAMADRAVRIGPAPVAESYLRGDAIIEAARTTGAEAVHPGYGFLSENPDFVEAVAAAGLTFIGPPAGAIRAMGLKDAAKALMERAGVPVVPGYHGADQNADTLAKEAEQIGYPVLIKARAGGGGKGMRRVENSSNFRSALEAAQREAEAAFGDPACLIEKYVDTPRHVEIQVFADAHGNVVHLFERDCSLQRRHQKVIEEAPAPGMPEDVRAAMGAAAVEAARAIGYVGAGTVEFIADGSQGLRQGGFWFMEMNTRLQVEHPVTEAITGLDLVDLQLRVAAGEHLPFKQSDLSIKGHAFEARIYAEDPERDFLPAVGMLERLRFPNGAAFRSAPVRVDAGVREGDQVTPNYDPMIAKLIVHGADRPRALKALDRALQATEVAGLTTNVPFLLQCTRDADFAAGKTDTGLIARTPGLTAAPDVAPDHVAVAALAAMDITSAPAPGPWTTLRGFRAWGPAAQTVTLLHGGERLDVAVDTAAGVTVNGTPLDLVLDSDGVRLTRDGRARRYSLHRAATRVTVFDSGTPFGFDIVDLHVSQASQSVAGNMVASPMPGKVTRVTVAVGEDVHEGQALMILEAMKMEHTLVAPRNGTVSELAAAPGDQVNDGTVLVRLEPADG